MRKVLFLATMFAFILTSSAWAADISGNWTLKMTGPQGEETVPLVIKAAGENLTVTGTHASFKEMTGTGTLKGDAITFNLKSTMEFTFTGKVTGNKMAGTREVKMGSGGGQGGAGGAAGGGAPAAGGAAPAAGGAAPAGGGAAPAGGGAAPAGGGAAPAGGGAAPAGGGAAGGQGGGQTMSSAWTADKN
jgi:hypothetical protein